MIVLDVFIGIVLIYFLYSLLASIIAEMIATWIGMRARMLRQGIENILNDTIVGTKNDFFRWLKDIFLVEDKSFKYTSAGKFYEEPTIKYLAKPGEQQLYSLRNRKPAYISQENFVITILNMFSNKGRGISEWDKIKFSIETNALHLEPETQKMFLDFVKRANGSFEQFVSIIQNHFADTMDRVNGWYKRKIGTFIFFIGLIICIALNVDSINIVKELSNNEIKRVQLVELAEKVMEKKSGIDSLMTKKDSLNELKYKKEAYDEVRQAVINANNIISSGWQFPNETKPKIIQLHQSWNCPVCKRKWDRKKLSELSNNAISYNDQITALQGKLDSIKRDSIKNILEKIEEAEIKKALTLDSLGNIINLDIVSLKEPISLKENRLKISGQFKKSFLQKIYFIISQSHPGNSKFYGLLITALALTLGAQFWFDLLKKLVALRGAGIKPEESQEKRKQLDKLKLKGDFITSKDPVEIAISENRGYWEGLPGFIGIDTDYSSSIKTIELLFQRNYNLKLDANYPVYIDGKEYLVPVKVKQGGIINVQDDKEIDKPDFTIYNRYKSIYGTPCGIVNNNRTNKHALLTCAHVTKLDKSIFFDEKSTKADLIINKRIVEAGYISNLVLSCYCDASLIDLGESVVEMLKNDERIERISTPRKLTDLDFTNPNFTVRTKYEKRSNVSITKIANQIKVADYNENSILKFFQLLKFEDKNNPYKELTTQGDSGSLVTDNQGCPIAMIIAGGDEIDESGNAKYYSLGFDLVSIFEILQVSPSQLK